MVTQLRDSEHRPATNAVIWILHAHRLSKYIPPPSVPNCTFRTHIEVFGNNVANSRDIISSSHLTDEAPQENALIRVLML